MKVLAALAALLLLASTGWAQTQPAGPIFSVSDGSGVLHLTDRVDERPHCLVVPGETARRPTSNSTPALPPARIRDLVRQAAAMHKVDPALIYAVMATESQYSPRATSPKGALGLMQLLPSTARLYGVSDPFDPRQNIDAGTWHLRRLLDRFDGNKPLALAAYNAGEAAVQRHGGVPAFAETLAYVPAVLRRYEALRTADGPPR